MKKQGRCNMLIIDINHERTVKYAVSEFNDLVEINMIIKLPNNIEKEIYGELQKSSSEVVFLIPILENIIKLNDNEKVYGEIKLEGRTKKGDFYSIFEDELILQKGKIIELKFHETEKKDITVDKKSLDVSVNNSKTKVNYVEKKRIPRRNETFVY
jgi:hypothetical protein